MVLEKSHFLEGGVAERVVAHDGLAVDHGSPPHVHQESHVEISSSAQHRHVLCIDIVELVGSEHEVMQVPSVLTHHQLHLLEIGLGDPVV